MSRIGREPITVPAGVTVTLAENNEVTVKGPKGTLTQTFPSILKIENNAGVITVTRPDDEKETRALHGTARALLNGMVVGVTSGFERKLEIIGVGYRAEMKGKDLLLHLGYSHDILMTAPQGITFEIPGDSGGLKIKVSGSNKQQVGQIAAVIRGKRPPEPYHGKGIRYAGEYVRSKAGKAGK